MARYVVVDTPSKKILGGPYSWDGSTSWTPPVAGTLMLEQTARSGGYTVVANTAEDNARDLQAKASNAININKTFLNIANPTNAQVIQQVQNLTKENTALIKLMLGLLDDTAGT